MKKARAILHVTIQGRVQGVGYRDWVQRQAIASRLEGWVRNRKKEGTVEAVFAGAPKAVAEMVALCRHGPPSARVEAVLNETGHEDELSLRVPGEAFSVLSTV